MAEPTVPAPAVTGTRRRLWYTVLTGLSQGISFLGVAGLGLLIASQFGSSAVTDGFFIAQSVYGISVLAGQSLRTTAVAELSRRPDESPGETLGAIAMIALGAAVLFALVAFALVPVLTSGLPERGTEAARDSLLLLWPAAAMQLFGGALAALLATRDRVAVSAAAYSVGSLLGLLAFLPLRELTGSTSLPLVLLITSGTSTVFLAVAVWRSGGLPRHRPAIGPTALRARRLLIGSSALIVGQLVVASSVGLAGQVGEQAATTYSYGMMAISLVSATAVTPAMIVLAPVLASEWDGHTASLTELALRVFRLGALVVVPIVAGVVLVGTPVLRLLMPPEVRDTVPDIAAVIIVLSPTVLATLMVIIPELGLVTQGRLATLAGVSVVVVAVHIVASLIAVAAGGGIVVLAAVAVTTATLSASAVTAIGAGKDRAGLFGGIGVALAQLVAVPALGYLAAAELIGHHQAFGSGLAAWAVGSAIALAWLLLARRDEVLGVAGMFRATRSA